MEAFHRFLLRSPTAGLQCMSQLKIHWGGFAYWPWYETYQGQQALEHNESWADICSTIAAMGGLRELTIRGWLRRDRNDRFEFPNLDDYDTLVKVVAPLGGLTNRVNFQSLSEKMQLWFSNIRTGYTVKATQISSLSVAEVHLHDEKTQPPAR